MTPSKRLAELGIVLPEVVRPVGSYVPAIVEDDLVLTSGQVPLKGGKPTFTGKVGAGVTLDQARDAAELCAANALASAASAAGGIDNIERMIRVCVYVASAPDFTDQPKVANAASDLLFRVFGEAGRHVRSAVGVAVLPMDVPVELELTARLRR